MKLSEAWLAEFFDSTLDHETLISRLTMAGIEVEKVEPVSVSSLPKVVIGQIVAITLHKMAPHLSICSVDVAEDRPLQIICDIPHIKLGTKVPCAKVGAVLPGGLRIEKQDFMGIESFGMLCSAKSLGVGESEDQLLHLSSEASIGQEFYQYYALNDHILTLKLTPNRADCLSAYGLARDISAIMDIPLKSLPNNRVIPYPFSSTVSNLSVSITAKEACSRYCGRLIYKVNVAAPTPDWMICKLMRSGIRTVSAIIDITNYVMLELGQPLHAFDADTIKGDIDVRWAKFDENILLLNEREVRLDPNMLVIADTEGSPLALAGIMGGMHSAVNQETTTVFIESAFFNPSSIAGRARKLGLNSEAAYRYERGVDPALSRPAIERATALIVEICGGLAAEIHEVVTDFLPPPVKVSLRLSKITKLLGLAISENQVMHYLSVLAMSPDFDGKNFTVTVPSYRFDITTEEDLIEEIARLYGYDRIPISPIRATISMLRVAGDEMDQVTICSRLLNREYYEVVNYAFVDPCWEQDFAANANPIKLKNPLASQMSVLRSNLLGGLINTLQKNLNRQQERIRIFEIGCVFKRQNSDIESIEKIAGLSYGSYWNEQWAAAKRETDFYDIKSDIEALCFPKHLRFKTLEHPALHPGRGAHVLYDDKIIGFLGELHPQWTKQYALPRAPLIFEIDYTIIKSQEPIQSAHFSKQPMVRRDLSFVVEENLAAQQLLDALCIVSKTNAIIQNICIFDLYSGPGIEPGKKSLAFKILLQDESKTLTDAEVDNVIQQLIECAYKTCGATLRL